MSESSESFGSERENSEKKEEGNAHLQVLKEKLKALKGEAVEDDEFLDQFLLKCGESKDSTVVIEGNSKSFVVTKVVEDEPRSKKNENKQSFVKQIKSAFKHHHNYYHTITSSMSKMMGAFHQREPIPTPSTSRRVRQYSEGSFEYRPFIIAAQSITTDPGQRVHRVFDTFFKIHTCYDVLPTSAKVVVLHVQMKLKDTLFALLENKVRAAPLWDDETNEHPGIFTVTDFIMMLYSTTEELETLTLKQCKERLNDEKSLITLKPDDTLYAAIELILKSKIHRIPVIDPEAMDIIGMVTLRGILKFMLNRTTSYTKLDFFAVNIIDSGVATMDNIETIDEDTPIIEVLRKFIDRNVSAMPVVDSKGRLIDVCAKSDIITLAIEKKYSKLDQPWHSVSSTKNYWYEGVNKCSPCDTICVAMERMANNNLHRLVIVDATNRLIGMISLSDIMGYIITGPRSK